MSGSTGNKSFGAEQQTSSNPAVFSLTLAQSMLPLVERIVTDILHCQRNIAELQPEHDDLEQRRRYLDWPRRQRRYQVQEQLTQLESVRLEVINELRSLGVALIDPKRGRIGFPTIVNDRRACFSWRLGEESIRYWHFADDPTRRSIPSAWYEELVTNS